MMPHSPEPPRLVFVYGTLRSGGRNDIARFRPEPRRVADASIAGTLYDLGSYPGAVLGGAGRIAGEIYEIERSVEAQLDVLEEVRQDGTGEYLKREVVVQVGERGLTCLVYEIHSDRIRGRRTVASGDWFCAR